MLKEVKEALVSAVIQFIDEKRRVQGGSSIDTKVVEENIEMLNEVGVSIYSLVSLIECTTSS